MAYQPIILLNEGSQRTRGRDAQWMNIAAGKAVAEAVRTTLGPQGMDKMLVDSTGNVVVTNDGVTILKKMDIEHPAAQMLVEVAESQEDETGDGTTTAAVLSGELLREAEGLLDEGVHATTIVAGYRLAAEHAVDHLREIATDVSDDDALGEIARTAMTGKGVGDARDHLADLVIRAARAVEEDGVVDDENVAVETVATGTISNSQLVEGVIVDKEPAHPDMPLHVEDAKIALLDTPLEVAETGIDAEVNLTDPDQLEQFIEREEAELRSLVESITDAGANVVFCQKGIDDMAQHFLAKEGVLAVRRAKKGDVKRLARATGARIVSKVDEIEAEDLGYAGTVVQRDVGTDEFLFVEDCENPKAVTLLLRGGTEHVVEEVERSVEDALGVVAVTIEDGEVLPGGGAPEIEVAMALRDYADSIGGREQLAIEAFADAVEVVPRTLAVNLGLDPIDAVVDLRAAHDAGELAAGLSVEAFGVADMAEEGVVEPLRVKTQAVQSAQEAAQLVLRIDDVVAAGNLKSGSDDDEFDDDFDF